MAQQDNSDLLSPPSIRWYCKKWLEATEDWDPEKYTWYHRLLMWSATESPVPGYLPDNDIELRRIAGFKEDPNVRSKDPLTQELAQKEHNKREIKWSEVMQKFHKSTIPPDLLYNKLIRSTVEQAIRDQQVRGRNGYKLQQTKEISDSESKTLGTKGNATSVVNTLESQEDTSKSLETNEIPTALGFTSPADASNTLEKQSDTQITNKSLPLPEMLSKPRGQMRLLASVGLGLEDSTTPSLSRTLTQPLSTKRLLRCKPLTIFEESKFHLDEGLRSWLREKHPDFDEGDWEYLKELFCNSREGTTARSWRKQFHTYVKNAREWYEPGRYKRRPTMEGVNNNDNRYESAAERNERLAKDEDEYVQRLRSGGSRDSPQSSQALQLPSDATRRT